MNDFAKLNLGSFFQQLDRFEKYPKMTGPHVPPIGLEVFPCFDKRQEIFIANVLE
jgi:hypothetical protein